jgi:hypothetical protein
MTSKRVDGSAGESPGVAPKSTIRIHGHSPNGSLMPQAHPAAISFRLLVPLVPARPRRLFPRVEATVPQESRND